MRIENDLRVRTRGELLEGQIDRSHRGRLRLTGKNHHPRRQPDGKIECECVQDQLSERCGPLLRCPHVELIVRFPGHDFLAIESRRQLDRVNADRRSAHIYDSSRNAIERINLTLCARKE